MKRTGSSRDALGAALERVADADRSPCVSEERLVSLYQGVLPEPEADEIRSHLSVCPRCAEAGRDARRFLEAMRGPAPGRFRGAAVLLGLAAAAVLVIAWLGGRAPVVPPTTAVRAPSPPAPARWADLAIDKAPYVPAAPADDLVWRDGEEEAAGPDPLAAALAPYVRDDFPEAARRLSSHLERHPRDVRARFYRGVSLLLAGRPAEARLDLRQAVRDARPDRKADARWYLALACLRETDEACATRELEALAASPAHRAAAAALLQRVRSRTP